jgi:hypothetical protein
MLRAERAPQMLECAAVRSLGRFAFAARTTDIRFGEPGQADEVGRLVLLDERLGEGESAL